MNYNFLFIDGEWTEGASGEWIDVENPWTKKVFQRVPRGNETDVNTAVAAARRAFDMWSQTPMEERIRIMESALDAFKRMRGDMIELEIDELGQPRQWTTAVHVDRNYDRIRSFINIAKSFQTEEKLEFGTVYYEPIGVVGCMTPWNYPMGQIVQKVIPAILAGNTVILKPSQFTPLSAYLLAQAFIEAGLPKGVFNLVTGRGSEVGNALCLHPDVDMISFTGSTESGRQVGRQALSTIKKIALELGGKSPFLCLPGSNYTDAAKGVCASTFANSGQTCVAFTRFIVPSADLPLALAALKEESANWIAGDPRDENSKLGPIISDRQYQKVCELVASGVAEGANLFVGAVPDPHAENRLVQPIIFTDVHRDMRIVKEEIFGPVIVVQTYENIEEGIAVANDTNYGLGGAVVGPDNAEAVAVAKRIKAGQVFVNHGKRDIDAPFGGYKESGIGREGGKHGLMEYFEVKAIFS